MSHRSIEELEEELNVLADEHADKLRSAAEKYIALYRLKQDVTRTCAQAYGDLQDMMEAEGLKSIGTETAKVVVSSKRGWRIREGDAPDDHMRNMEEARAWVEKYNPQVTSITQATLKATWDAQLEVDGGDAPLPSFLEETEVATLSVRKA